MFDFDDPAEEWDSQRKEVRLLELPRLVVFPHVVGQFRFHDPKHIGLIEDALTSDQYIAVGTGRIRSDAVVCMCRIVAHTHYADGSYLVLMIGLRRLRLTRSLSAVRYRDGVGWVEAELCEDPAPPEESPECERHRFRLAEIVFDLFEEPDVPDDLPDDAPDGANRSDTAEQADRAVEREERQNQLRLLFSGEIPLGSLCDILASMFDFNLREKQALLAETVVERRVARLLHGLSELRVERLYDRLRVQNGFQDATMN